MTHCSAIWTLFVIPTVRSEWDRAEGNIPHPTPGFPGGSCRDGGRGGGGGGVAAARNQGGGWPSRMMHLETNWYEKRLETQVAKVLLSLDPPFHSHSKMLITEHFLHSAVNTVNTIAHGV